ncbi:MAG: DUF835 domain-containing protein, partial [Candidatus Methanoperedens sp.]|nr:DUF835 domain-containing protein [Candidatus Methanoperedens sp.]
MLGFIIWAIGTFNLALIQQNAPLSEVVMHMRLQLSGVILALTVFVFFALSFTITEKALKSPLTYLIIIPSLYLLYIIWTSDVSRIGSTAFSTISETKPELFLYSTVFAVAGIYLLFRYYMKSKYRERMQAKFILTGAITAILIAVIINIILPMFFDIHFLALSTLAPAVMGIFIAYAIYQYGLFIKPMPELSVTSFCGVECTLCPEYQNGECLGCRFDRERYSNCAVYRCVVEKGYKDCGDCAEIIDCLKRQGTTCFGYVPNMKMHKYCLEPGSTYFVKNGYDYFLDAVHCGAYGIVATTAHPQQIKEKYHFTSTPIVWISDEALEMGVKPADLKRLSILLTNFMKTIGNAVVILDGIDTLITINGFENMQRIILILNSAARTTNSLLIIPTALEGETLNKLKQGMELKAGVL